MGGILGGIAQLAGTITQGVAGCIQAGQPAAVAKQQKEAAQTQALASALNPAAQAMGGLGGSGGGVLS